MQDSSDFCVTGKGVTLKYGKFEMILIDIYLAYSCLFQEPLRCILLVTPYNQNPFAVTYK